MSVFCIGNIDIRDFEKYRNSGYLENAARTITEYGGRYRVRGGQKKIIEGQPVLHLFQNLWICFHDSKDFRVSRSLD